VTTYRIYRSAMHPDFIRHEVEPRLVERELTTALAPTVAGLMDYLNMSIDEAVDYLMPALCAG